ncbi:MAG: hypothetical protein IKM29_05450 [Clostridia bacterium]|nr:hypothetical protein [Clostridia bacterium]
MSGPDAFGMTVAEVGLQSPKRLRVTGIVEGDRIYRGDIVEFCTAQGKVTACVQSVRDGRKRRTSADPGEEVSLILPGVRKDSVEAGMRLCRSKLGSWRRVDHNEETELPVNVLLLKTARNRYIRLSSEYRALAPVRIAVIIVCALTALLAIRRIVSLVATENNGIRLYAGLFFSACVVLGGTALIWSCIVICRRFARRHICFDKTPLKLKMDRIELSYRSGAATYRSEVMFSDIDSIEYYPRYGCVKVNAPVRVAKIKNGEIVGTMFERSSEKAFQVYFLIYMDNDLFLRSLSERSGVPVDTVGSARPDVDGARY